MRAKIGLFHSVLPRHQATQDQLAHRLAFLHSQADATTEAQRQEIEPQILRRIERFGCEASRISRRFFEVDAFLPSTSKDPASFGAKTGWTQRMGIYQESLNRVFTEWYPNSPTTRVPRDLIHVSCTGYIAPSPAQTRIAALKKGEAVRVTHAYHMGCYAALPALRIAEGLVAAGSPHVDIAHTELCTLHLQVGRTEPEQLVIQSLFGDGYIRWSLFNPKQEMPEGRPYFELLDHSETLIPDSAHDMSWNAGETGWQMTLTREVPTKIREALPHFVQNLVARHGIQLADCVAAIHPGGPRIIDEVAAVLELQEEQIRFSKKVLFEHGNLSSATLPHIWEQILQDADIQDGRPVLSLAFGPGLTLCGALLRKRKGAENP